MPDTDDDSFGEKPALSRDEALRALADVGYEPLAPGEAAALRDGDTTKALLTGVLARRLRALNEIEYKGATHEFSDASIHQAIQRLREVSEGPLMQANKKAHERLTLGVSIEQTVEGDAKSFQVSYIDWEEPAGNVYHVAEGPAITETGAGGEGDRRPDLVLYVNGIPLVVIETRERAREGIERIRRHQRAGGPAERLFCYAQLLIATGQSAAYYATTREPPERFVPWREEAVATEGTEIGARAKAPPPPGSGDPGERPTDFPRSSTFGTQSPGSALRALCHPERLLPFTRRYVVFGAEGPGDKKLARPHQYFAVERVLRRAGAGGGGQGGPEGRLEDDREAEGGIIWHARGSGSGITMVLLAKELARARSTRALLVTGRAAELARPLRMALGRSGSDLARARTGRRLARLIEGETGPGGQAGRAQAIMTRPAKFETAACKARSDLRHEAGDLFVLVDEDYLASSGGKRPWPERRGALEGRMRGALPNARYIGLTGTPLRESRKEEAERELGGGVIDGYPACRAALDGVVAPVLYEERHLGKPRQEEKVEGPPVPGDAPGAGAPGRLRRVCRDIAGHYSKHWQGSGLKAQVIASSREEAARMRACFREDGRVRAATLRAARGGSGGSPPEENSEPEPDGEQERKTLASFGKAEEGPEILITSGWPVPGPALPGFGEPRCGVLYVNRSLRGRALLEATARVNRPHPEKTVGYVFDYRGVLAGATGAKTLVSQDALSGYEGPDVEKAVLQARTRVNTLGERHEALWDFFRPAPGGPEYDDPERIVGPRPAVAISPREKANAREGMERYLASPARRRRFGERLHGFTEVFGTALATQFFPRVTSEEMRALLRRDLIFFWKTLRSVRVRYAERGFGARAFGRLAPPARKMLGRALPPDLLSALREPADPLGPPEAFEEAVRAAAAWKSGDKQKRAFRADATAHRIKRVAEERTQEDPVLYERLSEEAEDLIERFRRGQTSEAKYLSRAKELERQEVGEKVLGNNFPARLKGRLAARAYYGVLQGVLQKEEPPGGSPPAPEREQLAEAAETIEEIVAEETGIVDWRRNPEAERRMRNAIEEHLYFELGLQLDATEPILDSVVEVAKSRLREAG